MGFFKAYDMRGVYGVDFDLALVRKIGAALPRVIPGERWLIGRDVRLTSPDVRSALLDGLASAGVQVTDLGLCTTPMVYYFTASDGYDASVMITASHNPPTDNGLKVSKKGSLPVGYSTGLNEVERLVGEIKDAPFAIGSTDNEHSLKSEYIDRYCDWISSKVDLSLIKSLSFAVDCSNGMASIIVKKLFPNAVVVNDTLDGAFPSHSPNPLKAEARAQLSAIVKERALDCGVIFDGDADRAMFVDETGGFVQPDYLIGVIAKESLCAAGSGKFSRTVLHDIRTSRAVIEFLSENGFEPCMVPVGHAFAKPKMRETNALCGGELAGHYYFGDFFGCDSGVLAALRVLCQVAKAKDQGMTFSTMMRPIVAKYANSGEINFKVLDKDAAIGRMVACAEKLSRVISVSTLDGVRIDMEDGWVNVRKSNTEPYLRLVLEATDKDKMQKWIELLSVEVGQ